MAVIDALEKNELEYGNARSLTGSSAKEDKAEDYSLDGKFHSVMSVQWNRSAYSLSKK